MPFPKAQRVVYERSPLDQVICQLRFPPILRIDSTLPVEFQDRIRGDYPNFAETTEYIPNNPFVAENIPAEIVQQVIQASGTKNYEFSSGDGSVKINLTRTFLALTTNKYERWEKFREKISGPFQALKEIYAPAYFSRIGLRYIDSIKRSTVDLGAFSWHELLNPALLGMLGSPETADSVKNIETVQEIQLAEQDGLARIRSKLVKSLDGEEVFIIDSDFFIAAKTEVDDAINKLVFFNSRSTRLIRWAIKDRLHEALHPQKI